MKLLDGQRGVVMGVANQNSIAAGCAEFFYEQGARMAFSHLPDAEGRNRMEQRVRRVADPIEPLLVAPCNVQDDAQVTDFFAQVKESAGSVNFLLHSIAFAPADDIRCETIDVSRKGFLEAMDISVYSLISTVKAAAELMPDGGSIVTMTYYGGEKVVPGYNLMGLCKAALESAVRYLACDLGPRNIRINAISAGPIKTLAAAGIGNFNKMLSVNSQINPMARNVTTSEVARTAAYLASDLGAGVTGEVLHVDAGYHAMGGVPAAAAEKLTLT